MLTASIAFLSAVLVASVLTPIVRKAARELGLLDHALSSRKVHGQPIPRLGGIAIVGAFFTPLIGLLFVDSEVGALFTADLSRVAGLFLGGALMALLGVYDDLRGADARTKFAVQFAVAGLMYGFGYRIDVVTLPVLGAVELGAAGFPLTVLWITGVTNAVNLIDGLDGLAGGIAFIAVAGLFTLAMARGDVVLMLFTAALAGAVLGFLFFNFNPASIFMGDSGSLFLGFVLATASVATNTKAPTAVMLLVPTVLLGIPIADTLLAVGRRALRGLPLFTADRGHIHHRLLALGLSHRQTVLVLYAMAASLAVAALVLAEARDTGALLTLGVIAVGAYVALRLLGFFDWARIDELLAERRRNIALRIRIAQIGARLRDAEQPDELWTGVLEAVPTLGVHRASLTVPGRGGTSQAYTMSSAPEPAGMLHARFSLIPDRPSEHVLELGWADGRTQVGRETEIAVELLCRHLATGVQRMRRGASSRARRMPPRHQETPGTAASL